MAIPDSLARWREFMSKRAVEPERLSMKRLQALSPEAKEAYDQQRFAWIGADTVLETKDSSQIEKHLRIVQARGNAPSATAKRAFAISGRAGLGKSTTALNLGRKHERARRRTLGDGPDVTPVVYASSSRSPSGWSLSGRMSSMPSTRFSHSSRSFSEPNE